MMNMERGSKPWWAILVASLILVVHLNHAAQHHLNTRGTDYRKAGELNAVASNENRLALIGYLRSFLYHARGMTLHEKAAQLENRTFMEQEAWEQQEHRLEDFKKLLEHSQDELERIRERESRDEAEEQEAEESAQSYQDEISRIQGEYGEFCVRHAHLPMCQAVSHWIASFDGTDQQTTSLAMEAEREEKKALDAMADENEAKSMEVVIESNVTALSKEVEDAELVEEELKAEYQTDERNAEILEANATSYINSSKVWQDRAVAAERSGKEMRDEASKLTRDGHLQLRGAIFQMVLSVGLVFGLLWILLDSLANLWFFSRMNWNFHQYNNTNASEEKARLLGGSPGPANSHVSGFGSDEDPEMSSIDLQSRSSASPDHHERNNCFGANVPHETERALLVVAMAVLVLQLFIGLVPSVQRIWPRFPGRLVFAVALCAIAWRAVKVARHHRTLALTNEVAALNSSARS